MTDAIRGLRAVIEDLARTPFPGCANPYREADEDPTLDAPGAAGQRRSNLERYLAARSSAQVLLVGEAIGYRGGRFSGIAFTSERWLAAQAGPYAMTSTKAAGWAEPSSTIVHGALAEHRAEHAVILWNTVPAHPYRAGRPLSNRPPLRGDVDAGLAFLDRVIDLVEPDQIVAVGRIAERALGDRATGRVRHPSQGGAPAFRAGLARLFGASPRSLGSLD